MDYTYNTVDPSIHKYKLMVLYGYNKAKDTTVLCGFF